MHKILENIFLPFNPHVAIAPAERLRYAKQESIQSDVRPNAEWENIMGFKIADLKGKTVLDLGGVIGGESEQVFKNNQVNIIPLNIVAKDKSQRGIRALAQQLPLSDNSCDVVFSYGAIPGYLEHSIAEIKAVLEESMRVLKPGEQAYFYPITEFWITSELKDMLNSIASIDTCDFKELGECQYWNAKSSKQLWVKVFRLVLKKK